VPERETILIAAPSGRALASAAREAGYDPRVVDFFDDLDTRALCSATRRLDGDHNQGFDKTALLTALEELARAGSAPLGFVYGGGFEDRLDLLEAIAEHFPVLGNSPHAVARVKDPQKLADLCAALNIPHPEIAFAAPDNRAAWLVKHGGGAGGVHVVPADETAPAAGDYYQRKVAGTPVSALLLADGQSAMLLGFSRQWTAPAPGQPYRFAGCARPASLSNDLAQRMTNAATAIIEAAHLKGLNSIDFLVDSESFHLIEINPRPGATLDIFHGSHTSLLKAHVAACAGTLPATPLRFEGAEAASFVFADAAILSMPALDWPLWTADRQAPGSPLAEHDPVCTVLAQGHDLASALALLDERIATLKTRLQSPPLDTSNLAQPTFEKDAAA